MLSSFSILTFVNFEVMWVPTNIDWKALCPKKIYGLAHVKVSILLFLRSSLHSSCSFVCLYLSMLTGLPGLMLLYLSLLQQIFGILKCERIPLE